MINTSRMNDTARAADESLDAVAQTMKGLDRPIRLRVPLQLWTGKEYLAWRGEVWKVEVRDKAEARELNLAMEKFFDAIGKVGAPAVFTALQAAMEADR